MPEDTDISLDEESDGQLMFAGMGPGHLATNPWAQVAANLNAALNQEIEYTCADLRPICDNCNSRESIHEVGAPLYHFVCTDPDSCTIRRAKAIANGDLVLSKLA